MKKLLLLTLSVMAMHPLARLHAEEAVYVPEGQLTQYDRVVITTHDNQDYVIWIDGDSRMSSYWNVDYDGFVIDVLDNKGELYTFRRNEVRSIRFVESDEQSLGIHRVINDADEHYKPMTLDHGVLRFSPAMTGRVCYVRNVSGRVAMTYRVEAPYSVSIDALPAGIYFITLDNTTIKIMKS